MARRWFLGCFAILCLSVSGCQPPPDAQSAELVERIKRVESRLDSEEEFTKDIHSSLNEIREKINEYDSAQFDPSGPEGFKRIDAGIVTIAVSLDDVKSQADGSRVLMRVGNMTTATLSRTQFHVKYGNRAPLDEDESSWKKRAEWRKSLKSVDIDINNNLVPGTWNKVWLTLPGVPPGQLGYVFLTVNVPTVSMNMPH